MNLVDVPRNRYIIVGTLLVYAAMTIPHGADIDELIAERFRAGFSKADVVLELIANGYTRDDAREIVNRAQNEVRAEQTHERQNDGNVKMVFGACFFLLGVGTLLYSFVATAGTLVVIPGTLIIIGSWYFFNGLFRV